MAWMIWILLYPIILSATGACLNAMLRAMLFCLLSHACVLFDVSPGSASQYIISGLPPICLKAFSSAPPRCPACFPSIGTTAIFLLKVSATSSPALYFAGSFSLCFRSSKKKRSAWNSSVGHPGVELARALLQVVVLSAPLLDVFHCHALIVQLCPLHGGA